MFFFGGSCEALRLVGPRDLSTDLSRCDSADCIAIITSKQEHCLTNDCRAIVNRTPSACSETDCAILIEYLNYAANRQDDDVKKREFQSRCQSEGCRAITGKTYARCPGNPKILTPESYGDYLKREANYKALTSYLDREYYMGEYVKSVNRTPAPGYQAGFEKEKLYSQRQFELKMEERKRKQLKKQLQKEYSDLHRKYSRHMDSMTPEEIARYKRLSCLEGVGNKRQNCIIC